MSTDFNIKPVGAPVAAPIAQPLSDAAHNAVATELPASQSVTAVEASARTGNESDSVQVSISNAAAANAAADATAPEAAEQLRFRDRLRADSALVEAYVACKREVIARGIADSREYNLGKEHFIRYVLGLP